jgi:hypothetical protein
MLSSAGNIGAHIRREREGPARSGRPMEWPVENQNKKSPRISAGFQFVTIEQY